MMIHSVIGLLVFLIVSPLSGLAAEPAELKAFVVTGEAVITPQEVEEVSLKYDRGAFVVVVGLNSAGKAMLEKMSPAGPNRKMGIVFGDQIIAAPIPIMDEKISRLLIRIESEKTALEILKHFAK